MARSHSIKRPPGQRPLRVGEEIRHALARIFARGELRDPELADVTLTVTEVRVAPDLKRATAFVMPLAGRNEAEVMAALRRSAPYLRRAVGREVELRYAPDIVFALDTAFAQASRIDAALHRPEVVRDLAAPEPSPGEDDDGA
ncbi:MAG TPA: 30S ribosome-binding factor RbfA [Stellaceae bacterium]|nr:30S ribosome-binding factor RbfA [Stellaceae bacterium]